MIRQARDLLLGTTRRAVATVSVAAVTVIGGVTGGIVYDNSHNRSAASANVDEGQGADNNWHQGTGPNSEMGETIDPNVPILVEERKQIVDQKTGQMIEANVWQYKGIQWTMPPEFTPKGDRTTYDGDIIGAAWRLPGPKPVGLSVIDASYENIKMDRCIRESYPGIDGIYRCRVDLADTSETIYQTFVALSKDNVICMGLAGPTTDSSLSVINDGFNPIPVGR